MTDRIVYISVTDQSSASADQLIADLQSFLIGRTSSVKLHRSKSDPSAQEIGSILVATLAAPAIVELAKGVADWMRKRNASITLSADGSKKLEGPAHEVEKMLRELLDKQDEN